jgi:NADH:ubiquinone oxidoreductase subunit E
VRHPAKHSSQTSAEDDCRHSKAEQLTNGPLYFYRLIKYSQSGQLPFLFYYGEHMNSDEVLGIVERHRSEQGGLISILQDIQAKYSYLPSDALRIVAEETGRSLVDVYGVATFYRAFSLTPRGKHLLSVCQGTACHVRGGHVIADHVSNQLGVKPGQTTPDKEFTFETVNCLGACALGPIVVVDGHYFSNVSPIKVQEILEQARAGLDKVEATGDERIFPLEVSCSRCNHLLTDSEHLLDGHPSIHISLAFNSKHGWLHLSSLYGSRTVESEYEVPEGTAVDMFCPHCNAQLTGAGNCPVCEAALVPIAVRGGGIVQICSRNGCPYHMLDVGASDMEKELI